MAHFSGLFFKVLSVDVEEMFYFCDKTCVDHNEAVTMTRWPFAGAVSVALLSFSRLEGRTSFEDHVVKKEVVEVF